MTGTTKEKGKLGMALCVSCCFHFSCFLVISSHPALSVGLEFLTTEPHPVPSAPLGAAEEASTKQAEAPRPHTALSQPHLDFWKEPNPTPLMLQISRFFHFYSQMLHVHENYILHC